MAIRGAGHTNYWLCKVTSCEEEYFNVTYFDTAPGYDTKFILTKKTDKIVYASVILGDISLSSKGKFYLLQQEMHNDLNALALM